MLTLDQIRVQQGDFTIEADDQLNVGFVSVIGPSGSGKSTLLSAIAGFTPLANGRLIWGDEEFGAATPDRRPASMLFQDNNLFPHLTIAQNVGLALERRLGLSVGARKKVEVALDHVGLSGMADRKPGSLSGGQQSRAALARVLLADRPIVLLDEPFAALGPGLRHEMLDLVTEALGGRLVIMVTHEPSDAKRIKGQTIFVDDGCAHPAVETLQLFEEPSASLKSYLGQEKPASRAGS